MKKLLLLYVLCAFLLINCKNQNSQNERLPKEVGLKELSCDGNSILKKMNGKSFYDFDDAFGKVEKYSVELVAKPINSEIMDVSVSLDDVKAQGSVPNYICNLVDGTNVIKVTVRLKEEPSIKKEYNIKISKLKSHVLETQGSKLKEIKVDDSSILSRFNQKYVCRLSDFEQDKNEISLYVLPHNSNATVTIRNGNEIVNSNGTNTYKISIDYGTNDIYVLVNSEKEGELLHRIIIYRKQDLGLKSFKIEDVQYCDESTGELKTNVVKFPKETTNLKVKVLAKNPNAAIIFEFNGEEVKAKDGFYNLDLKMKKNAVRLQVRGKGKGRSKHYTMFLIKTLPTSTGLIKLEADEKDLIHLLSTSNSITIPPRDNENSKLKLEVLATSEITIKVKLEASDVNGVEGVYNIDLKEGNNKILVSLYKDETLLESYSIFVKRHIKEEEAKTPESDEVELTFILSDGVNGSPVDGSYINISKTQTSEHVKRILVKNGKAKTNLKKNTFYNFKVEGQNDEYSTKKYAASNIISYYIGDGSKVVPIVQRPMQIITKKAEAPIASSLSFGAENVTAGSVITSDVMKEISLSVITASPVEKLRFRNPLPMLAIGFVPSTDENKTSDVLTATMTQDSVKSGDKWQSIWAWNSDASLINEKDVVIVVYDIAGNRLEYHLRICPSSVAPTEDNEISIKNMSLKFRRLPTPSYIYSVEEDEGTKNSSHYTSDIFFEAKRGDSSIKLRGFELYRKCDEEGGDFELIKHVVYKRPKEEKHEVADTDGRLEDGKTYQYKVVAYTVDNKKSRLANSDSLSIKVPKSTSLLLEYPVGQAITLADAKKLSYVFRFSNPEILKDAIEINAGFLISDRAGTVLHGSKFRYVFDDGNGKPEIYFAKKSDAVAAGDKYYYTNYSLKLSDITTMKLDEIISVDKEKGFIKIKSDFFTLIEVNLVKRNKIIYKKGFAYYWDIIDYGVNEKTDRDDKPCKIIHKPRSNVTIISSVNDDNNGNNAWNGRAEFIVRADGYL